MREKMAATLSEIVLEESRVYVDGEKSRLRGEGWVEELIVMGDLNMSFPSNVIDFPARTLCN